MSIALDTDVTYGLMDNLSSLLGLLPLDLEPNLDGDAPPVVRAQQAQKDMQEFQAGMVRAKESAAFRGADDGVTPMLFLLLHGKFFW
jgi:hypothetical protein